jgi:outer membrane protein
VIRKYFSWLLLTVAMSAAGAESAELKVGILDIQQALMQSQEAQEFMETAQSDLQTDQDQVNTLQRDMQALQEQMQKDAEVMSPAEQRKRQKELEDKQIEYRFLVNRLQKDIQDRQQELMQQMGPKLEAVIKDIVDAEGYDLILQRGDLVYAAAEHSITRKVTEKLNEKRESSR